MAVRIPEPLDFEISKDYGFLFGEPPVTQFDTPYFKPWDDLASNLHDLLESGVLAEHIARLPTLQSTNSCTVAEYRRAYVILGFAIHAHVWSRSPPNELIPSQLATPFLSVCEHLRMEPVLSYAGLCTWNWKLRDGSGMDLDNMDTLISFTGTRGEAAFYHVPVLVESEGGHLIRILLNAIKAASAGAGDVVREALVDTTRSLVRMGEQLPKLYPKLDADFFYHKLRPFLAGGKGMEDKGLPHGMIFQKSDGSTKWLKLAGGSAAQSSLFPFLDYVLGIQHQDGTIFREMRQYMPGAHRDFLDHVSRLPSLRRFYEQYHPDSDLRTAYDACITQLRSWRGKHIAIVSKYIVQPARAAERKSRAEMVGNQNSPGSGEELQGTGGSVLIPFLRQARDETVVLGN